MQALRTAFLGATFKTSTVAARPQQPASAGNASRQVTCMAKKKVGVLPRPPRPLPRRTNATGMRMRGGKAGPVAGSGALHPPQQRSVAAASHPLTPSVFATTGDSPHCDPGVHGGAHRGRHPLALHHAEGAGSVLVGGGDGGPCQALHECSMLQRCQMLPDLHMSACGSGGGQPAKLQATAWQAGRTCNASCLLLPTHCSRPRMKSDCLLCALPSPWTQQSKKNTPNRMELMKYNKVRRRRGPLCRKPR